MRSKLVCNLVIGLFVLLPKNQPLAGPGPSKANDIVILVCIDGTVDGYLTDSLSTGDFTVAPDCEDTDFCGVCVKQLISDPNNCKLQSYTVNPAYNDDGTPNPEGDLPDDGVYVLYCQ